MQLKAELVLEILLMQLQS